MVDDDEVDEGLNGEDVIDEVEDDDVLAIMSFDVADAVVDAGIVADNGVVVGVAVSVEDDVVVVAVVIDAVAVVIDADDVDEDDKFV